MIMKKLLRGGIFTVIVISSLAARGHPQGRDSSCLHIVLQANIFIQLANFSYANLL